MTHQKGRPPFPDPSPRGYLMRARALFKVRSKSRYEDHTVAPYSNMGEFLYDADVMGA